RLQARLGRRGDRRALLHRHAARRAAQPRRARPDGGAPGCAVAAPAALARRPPRPACLPQLPGVSVAQPAKRARRRWLRLGVTVVMLALAAWFLARMGPGRLWQTLRAADWRLVL